MRCFKGSLMGLLLLATAQGLSARALPRDQAFWQARMADPTHIPEGESAGALALELADLLGSPDPFLRDQCGYGLLRTWTSQRILAPEDLESLRRKLVAGLSPGLGEVGTDSVLRRSFSALDLSVILSLDLTRPWTNDEAFAATLDAALAYLAAESDLRGFETGKGWIHATAHTADLLKVLGMNSRLQPAGQARIVAAIARRSRAADRPFAWGEDARLALALMSLARRSDFDPQPFEAWFTALLAENRSLWNGELDPAAYVRVRTQVNVLVHLTALIAREEDAVPESFRAKLHAMLGRI